MSAQAVQGAAGGQLQVAADTSAAERPQYVGVGSNTRGLPWRAVARISNTAVHLPSCTCRAAAAAAHDLANIWCRLRGIDRGTHSIAVNFPQLLEDRQLEAQLQAAADVPALKAFVADWLLQQWPQQEAALLAGRAAALDRYTGGTCREQGIYSHSGSWQVQLKAQGKQFSLGKFASKQAAGVVWDAGNVWRRTSNIGSNKGSRTFNHPQLRLWEDAQLMAGLQGVQDGKQLQAFLKGWAQQHLPAKLAQLHSALEQQQEPAVPPVGATASCAAEAPAEVAVGVTAAPVAAGHLATIVPAEQAPVVAGPTTGFSHGRRRRTRQQTAAAVAAAAFAGPPSAEAQLAAAGVAAGAEETVVAQAWAAAAVVKQEVVDLTAEEGEQAVVAGASGSAAAAPATAATAAAAVPALPPEPLAEAAVTVEADAVTAGGPASQAAMPLPELGSFAGDSGRPLKRRMLCELLPVLEAAGASAQHMSDFELDFVAGMSDRECRYLYGSLQRAHTLPDAKRRVLELTRC